MTTIHPARFDDLTPGHEHSFELTDPVDAVIAHDLDEVIPAVERVEAAQRDGLWAGGFIAYEAAPAFDPTLRVHGTNGSGLPLVWFGLYRERRPVSPVAVSPDSSHEIGAWHATITEDEHREAIEVIRDRIAAGDTYQANFTFRLHAPVRGDLNGLYADLLHAQRGGFGAWIDTGDHAVLSASPELFFHIEDRTIRVKPMKGTIRRGRWPAEDEAQVATLLTSEKDRAENLMIVDLLRNDLGRLARFGSVDVTRLFEPEPYETVWQLTSTIGAELEPDTGLPEVFRALFPSGSVTGAPKASTMDIIAGLESTPRGVYCGAVGYAGPIGDAQFNVAIRTVVVDRSAGVAEYGTGGGITWDSTAAGEYAEALLKTDLLGIRREPFWLLATMRRDPSGYRFIDRHLARLDASAERFGFAFDPAATRRALGDHDGPIPARVRVLIGRDGTVEVETAEPLDTEFVMRPEDMSGDPVRLAIAPDPIDPNDVFLFHKTTKRDVYEAARATARNVDEVVLHAPDGSVTESTIANLAVRLGTDWVTPPIESGCLPGVFRAELLETGAINERAIHLDDLAAADEIALINSVRGWRRAVIVD